MCFLTVQPLDVTASTGKARPLEASRKLVPVISFVEKIMSFTTSSIRVRILDSMPVVHYAVATRFAQEYDLQLIGMARTAAELMTQIDEAPCDVLIVDYTLSRENADGVALLRRLARLAPNARVLVWASDASPAYATLALRAGAAGFIDKTHADLNQLVHAVRTVASGRTCIEDQFRLVSAFGTSDQGGNADPSFEDLVSGLLSQREVEVLRCCLSALSISEAAHKFNRSVKTISTQKMSAYRKLGIRNDRELFKIAVGMGAMRRDAVPLEML